MKLKVISLVVITCLLLVPCTTAQAKHKINIPDILGYKTLKCDFHMHTVFSDGMVWPLCVLMKQKEKVLTQLQ